MYRIHRLFFFITEAHRVLSEVRSEFLYIMQIALIIQKVAVSNLEIPFKIVFKMQ